MEALRIIAIIVLTPFIVYFLSRVAARAFLDVFQDRIIEWVFLIKQKEKENDTKKKNN